jgi:DNA-binding CsgD family transcriptional regulator
MYVSSAMTAFLLAQNQPHATSKEDVALAQLTPSERRIMELIGEGQSSKEIGEVLGIHYRTVENHRTNMCRKLGLEGANALLRFALSHKSNR